LYVGRSGTSLWFVYGSAGGFYVVNYQLGQFRDELRRLFVAHPLPPDQGEDRANLAYRDLPGLVAGIIAILTGCHTLLRPGGTVAVTARPWRRHGELVDLPSAVIAAGIAAGLTPQGRLRPGARLRLGRRLAAPAAEPAVARRRLGDAQGGDAVRPGGGIVVADAVKLVRNNPGEMDVENVPPTELTCVPGASHRAVSTGCRASVQQHPTSAAARTSRSRSASRSSV
jgi:hypothetical protein